MYLPDKIHFIGLGPQKCGTTWIERQLRRHPDIFITKECPLWVPGLGPVASRMSGDRGFAEYNREPLAGTYHNSYVFSPAVLSLISRECPDAKFYVCLRDPVERTLSAFKHCTRKGRIHSSSTYQKTMKDSGIQSFTLDGSMYDVLLKLCRLYIAQNRLKVLIFEDICTDPEGFMHDLLRFLGADPEKMPHVPKNVLEAKVNEGFILRNYTLERVSKRVACWGKKAGKLNPAEAISRGINRFNRKYESGPLIPDETLRMLAEDFMLGVRKVEEALGRSLRQTWTRTCSMAKTGEV